MNRPALCCRCTGRRQQIPEPVGVHQWHHRSDGTGVKGIKLSGIPALLRGAALVPLAESPRHRIHWPAAAPGSWLGALSGHTGGGTKGEASQRPYLVSLEGIDGQRCWLYILPLVIGVWKVHVDVPIILFSVDQFQIFTSTFFPFSFCGCRWVQLRLLLNSW